ncbi:hypothetical protein Scep_007814 [Stephania cephalantha]|uniref:Uncharacterized protein n=1 Tax=Stephania cephalantha TaxID=152367 RepID=A0AAP0KD94_9MAGN
MKGEQLSKEVQLIRGENENFNMKAETMTIEEVKRQRSKATRAGQSCVARPETSIYINKRDLDKIGREEGWRERARTEREREGLTLARSEELAWRTAGDAIAQGRGGGRHGRRGSNRSRHGAEKRYANMALTATVAQWQWRKQQAPAGSNLAAGSSLASKQQRARVRDADGRAAAAIGSNARRSGGQTRETAPARCDATSSEGSDGERARRRDGCAGRQLRLRGDDAMARCRPIGCGVSTKSRRCDGGDIISPN